MYDPFVFSSQIARFTVSKRLLRSLRIAEQPKPFLNMRSFPMLSGPNFRFLFIFSLFISFACLVAIAPHDAHATTLSVEANEMLSHDKRFLPQQTQLGFNDAASPQMKRLVAFHDDLLMPIITITTIFVLALLLVTMVRFNSHANKEPSSTTHNVPLEILWTIVPVIILIVIAVPSFKLLFYLSKTPETEMTLKVTGYQWYWGYEYPDQEGINFLSYMIPDEDINEKKGQRRLLSTDNPVVLPIDTNIEIIITAADVLHAWTVPAFGVKKDAVPGRLNQTWVRIDEPGTYFGQCSEICGINHAFMPIEIKAVSKEEFKRWLNKAKKEFAAVDQENNEAVQLANIQSN